jgi:hypothetical protein
VVAFHLDGAMLNVEAVQHAARSRQQFVGIVGDRRDNVGR